MKVCIMEKQSNVLVIGKGLIGNKIYEQLLEHGYLNVTVTTHSDLELLSQAEVNAYFEKHRPEYVFFCAVKSITDFESGQVGDADELYMNVLMQCNIIEAARVYGVKKMILLGSAMLYPWNLGQEEPMEETCLEKFNLPGYRSPMHAAVIGKFVAMKLCQYYNKQYGIEFIYCLPSHIYGGFAGRKNLYLLERLVMDICDAKSEGKHDLFLDIFGEGISQKQFLHVDDCASAIICIMERYHPDELCTINVGSFETCCWKSIVENIQELVHYDGTIRFNSDRKENMANRISSVEKLRVLGWTPKISIKDGLRQLCSEYQNIKRGNLE